MPRRGSPYGRGYERARAAMRGRPCSLRYVCDGAPSTSADHVPPISQHTHVNGTGCCVLRPACLACQHHQAGSLAQGRVLREMPAPSGSW